MKGKIKQFNPLKGFGFITTEKGEDIFFHVKDFPELTARRDESVEFDEAEDKKGKRATKIRRAK